jgi:hypothetical protein
MTDIITEDQKNVAFGLFGISYTSAHKHWHAMLGDVRIDFQKSVEGYRNDLLKGKNYDCYLSTYDSIMRKTLLKTWKPLQYSLINNLVQDRFFSRNMHLSNVCKMILDEQRRRGKDYETVILTRFDLRFNKKPFDLSINMKALNLSARCERDPLIDDNLYVMPGYLLQKFYDVIEQNHTKSHHHIRAEFEKELGTINFMIGGNYLVSKNPIFTIMRISSKGVELDPLKVML